MSQYKDPIVQKYLDLIEENTTDIKGFYNGLVAKIPSSMLPAVMINVETTEADEHSNVEDEHRITLNLTYIADIRQSLEHSPLTAALNNLVEALVGREETGTPYALKSESILNILRGNLNVDSSNNLRTDVGSFSVITPGEIATGRFPGLYSAEGTIKFLAHFTQER